MTRYRISEHLFLDELVPITEYQHYALIGRLDNLARRIDKQLIFAYEMVRQELKEVGIVNNWWKIYVNSNFDVDKTYNEVENREDLFQWSGWRPEGTSFYKVDSMHSYFHALDVKWGGIHNVKVNKKAQVLIEKHWQMLGIGGLEIRNGWVHMDTRYIYKQKKLIIF